MKAFFTLIFLFCSLLCWSQSTPQDCPDLVNLGPDIFVCNGASFTLNPNPVPGTQYAWITSGNLSCNDCPSPTVSGLSTGVYIYIVIATNPQCTDSDTIRVNVLNGQQPSYIIAKDRSICLGASVNIGGESAPGTFYTWTSNPPGLSSTNANPFVTPTQTTTYYLEAQNGSCPVSSFDSVKISVYTQPVLSLQSDTAVCNGQIVKLGKTTPEPNVTYTWSPNAGTLSDSTLANPIATPTQTTLYTLTASNPGCISTGTVLIAVVDLNLNLSVDDSIMVCKGAPLAVQAFTNPVTSVAWSPLEGIQLTNNGKDALLNPSETTLYTITASLPGCTRKEKLFVRVDSLPFKLEIYPADTTVCIGSQVILKSPVYEPSDFPNIEFSWSPVSGQLTSDTLYNMVLSPVDTILYQRINKSGACSDTSFALVNVVKPPEIKITPQNSSICPGEQVQLIAVIPLGVTDIQWMPMNASISCTDCSNPIVTPTISTNYQISGKFQGCPTGATANVQVKTPPQIQIPTDLDLCQGESLQLNQINDPSTTYTWTSSDPAFGTVTVAQPVVVPTLPSTTYFVTAFNGCTTTDVFTVKVSTATLMTAGTATICQGGSALISASTSLPGSFMWSNGETRQTFNVMPTQTTTYTVVYAYGENCTLKDSVTISVQGQNAATAFPDDRELCPGESIQLNSLTVPGASYQWSSNPSGFSSADPQPVVTPAAGTTTYYLTTQLGICTKTDSVKVIVYSATLSLPADTTLCGGDDLRLTATANATGTYLWTDGNTTAQLSIDSLTKSNTYGVVFTYGSDKALCTLTESVKVNVKPSFNLKILADPVKDVYNLGENIDLTAIISPTMSLNGFNFVWKKNGQITPGSTDMISVVTDVSLVDTAILTYSITATSANGCSRTAIKQLILLPPVVRVANAFTPNGDGTNDVFKLLVLSGIAKVEHMEIYNRWGQRVYESNEENASWDGKVSGQEAPSDVYIYRIRWRDGSGALRKPEEGQVTLLR